MDTNRGPTGPISTFAEPDYRFGTGPLRMRVERIDWGQPVLAEGENWYEVYGIEIAADGREIGPRQALVRGTRLARQRRAGADRR